MHDTLHFLVYLELNILHQQEIDGKSQQIDILYFNSPKTILTRQLVFSGAEHPPAHSWWQHSFGNLP